MFISLNKYEYSVGWVLRHAYLSFATSFLPWVAVMCVLYCTPRKDWGVGSLTISAREINNQVSLLPLPFPILGLIKNSSVRTLQLSRSERLLENLGFSLAGPGIKKKKKSTQAESNFYAQFTVDFTLFSCKQLLRINICVWVVSLTLFCNKKPYCII